MSILVTTDLSTRSAAALRFAEELGITLDSSVSVLHVAPDTRPDILEEAENALDQFMREYSAEPEAHGTQVKLGSVVETITAASEGFGIVVCGATGSSYLDDIFLGSTASRLIRASAIPVCVVPDGISGSVKTIVAPISFDRSGVAGLELASSIAQSAGADVCLFHALDVQVPLYAEPPTDDDIARLEAEARGRLQDWADEAGLSDLAVRFEVARKDPAEGVRELVAEIGADLVVMGTHGRGSESLYFLGSVAERIVRQPPCAVITVRPEEPSEKYDRQQQ